MRVASTLCCAAVLLLSLASNAQTSSGPSYDVISIKPNKSLSHNISINIHDGVYVASNVTLPMLLKSAYDLKTDAQLSGVPGWANSASFDIEAKEDPDVAAATAKAPPAEREEHQAALLRALLAERFHLVIHHETKVLPTFSLLVGKGGVKFKEADPNAKNNGSTMIQNQKLTATGISLDNFARTLSGQLEREVVNKTELAGKYDLNLTWSRDDAPVESKDTTGVDSPPTLFTAVQEQLGLKLEPSKASVDAIVVDHVEPPSEN